MKKEKIIPDKGSPQGFHTLINILKNLEYFLGLYKISVPISKVFWNWIEYFKEYVCVESFAALFLPYLNPTVLPGLYLNRTPRTIYSSQFPCA